MDFLKKQHSSYLVPDIQNSKKKKYLYKSRTQKRTKEDIMCKVSGPTLNSCPRQDPPWQSRGILGPCRQVAANCHPCFAPRSLAVELDGIDLDRDGATSVAAPLLLGLLMPEGLAFGELQNLIGPFSPVSGCASLGIKGVVCHS